MQLADFAGTWTLSRRICDRKPHQAGRFSGCAVFEPGGDGLLCHESGRLRFSGGTSFKAERTYIWRKGENGIEVYFSDGRFFHAIALHDAVPTATHHCDDDTYCVTYDFSRWPNWKSHWKVSGPRKDYDMKSGFSPAGQSPAIEARDSLPSDHNRRAP